MTPPRPQDRGSAATGTYEVYIDVRHHPRHNEDSERHESSAFKVAVVGYDRPLRTVADCLRDFADELEEKEADV